MGVGIYESTPLIAANAGSPTGLLAVWFFGGALCLLGALCYAELSSRYPEEGGDYVYLYNGLGPKVAFLYGWTKLSIIRPGSIAAMAFVFARYMNLLLPVEHSSYYALASVLVLGGVNILGVREGKFTQNFLTAIKVIGILSILLAAFVTPHADPALVTLRPGGSLRLAVIFVLFAFGGWNEIAYVAGEVKNSQKNILRSLIWGTSFVTVLYVLINVGFVFALGYEGLIQSQAAATDVVRLYLGDRGANLISALIAISALGAINGMIFTGARISYAFGSRHRPFRFLGKWSSRLGTPARALATEALVTSLLVLFFFGDENGFESMVLFTTPVFWAFMTLVGMCLFVFRRKQDSNYKHAIYQAPLYPWIPIAFVLTSIFMLVASLTYAIDNWSWEVFGSLGIMGTGLLFLPSIGTPKPKN